MTGFAFEVGRDLARRLGVPFAVIEFPQMIGVLDAMGEGLVDVTTANPNPERAQSVDFMGTMVQVELGYLVAPGSHILTQEAVDQPGIRVGATARGASLLLLTRDLKQASVVPVVSPAAAGEMLAVGRLDAYASNKPVLFDIAKNLPGARVLEGRRGIEDLAIAIPKGRERGADFINRFVTAARSEGLMREVTRRARIPGVVPE